MIEEELVPQGQAKDAAACIANLRPFNVAGVAAALIVHANVDKFFDYEIDDNDGIIAVGDIPQQPPHAPLVVNDTNDDEDTVGSGDDDDEDNEDEDNDNSSDKDDDDMPAAATDVLEGNESDGDQGVQRLQCRGKGTTKKYTNYSLLMAARQARREGQRRAFIHDGCFFFSSDNLSDARPILKEDREEFPLGVVLVHYLMNTGIKSLKQRAKQK